ncbi:hypothetical protein J3E72DRAFT_197355 [Bipolaris maydis]|nr:hypothetical protein J3E72DRAFT_197355 [Bipolaris maydis]
MRNPISGPGVLFVRSRISPKSHPTLSESTFLTWYDTEHIPEVLSTHNVSSAFRYVDVSKTSPIGDSQNRTPFLTCYPMSDIAFTQSEAFRAISVKSEKLPGTGVIYDLADFEISYLGFLGATPRKGDGECGGIGRAKFMITYGVRPEEEPGQDKAMAFLDKQTAVISEAQRYVRTLYFKLLYARTNAQSRALKGLPTTDEPHFEPPTWLAIHEFSEFPEESLLENVKSDSKTILNELGNAEGWGNTESEMHAWKVETVHGEGKLFD